MWVEKYMDVIREMISLYEKLASGEVKDPEEIRRIYARLTELSLIYGITIHPGNCDC
jgi:hypothetical protein